MKCSLLRYSQICLKILKILAEEIVYRLRLVAMHVADPSTEYVPLSAADCGPETKRGKS